MIFFTLVLLTFCAGALAELLISRYGRTAESGEPDRVPVPAPVAAFLPSYVEGFLVPDGLRYHAGHTWVQRERRNGARVGLDDFAAKLAGNIDGIELPKPDQWFRQGQP